MILDDEDKEEKRHRLYREVVNRAEENMLECTEEKFEKARKHGVSDYLFDGIEGDTCDGCAQVLEVHTGEEQGEQRRRGGVLKQQQWPKVEIGSSSGVTYVRMLWTS